MQLSTKNEGDKSRVISSSYWLWKHGRTQSLLLKLPVLCGSVNTERLISRVFWPNSCWNPLLVTPSWPSPVPQAGVPGLCVWGREDTKAPEQQLGSVHCRGIPNQLLPSTSHWQWPEKTEQGPGYIKVLTAGCYLCSVIMSVIETWCFSPIALLLSHANIADFCILISSMSLLTCCLESQLLGWETKTTRCFAFHAEEVKLEIIFLKIFMEESSEI